MTTCLHPHYDETPASRRLRAWHLVEERSIELLRDGCLWVASMRVGNKVYLAGALAPVEAVEEVIAKAEADEREERS